MTRMAGRAQNQRGNRALILGTLAILVIYLLANLGYARTLGLDGLRRSTVGEHMPAAHLATLTLGDVGRSLLGTLIFVSCIGACMTNLLTAPRVFVPLAADGLFIAALRTPARARGDEYRPPPGHEHASRRARVMHAPTGARHEDEACLRDRPTLRVSVARCAAGMCSPTAAGRRGSRAY